MNSPTFSEAMEAQKAAKVDLSIPNRCAEIKAHKEREAARWAEEERRLALASRRRADLKRWFAALAFAAVYLSVAAMVVYVVRESRPGGSLCVEGCGTGGRP